MRIAAAKSKGTWRLANSVWWAALRSSSGVLPTWAARFENGEYMIAEVPKTFDEMTALTRSTIGTSWNSSGVLVESAVDVERFDHSGAALAPLGLLIEDAATRVNSDPRDFTGWTTVTTAQVAAAAGVDGVSKNIAVTDSSAGATEFRQKNHVAVLTNGAQYVVSCAIPVTSGAPTFWPGFGMDFGAGTTPQSGALLLDTQTGAVIDLSGSGDHDEIGSIRIGDWWLVWVTMTNTGDNPNMPVKCFPAANNTGLAGFVATAQGTTIFDYVQVELGSRPSSQIIEALTTRTADAVALVADGGLPHTGYNTDAAVGNTYVFKGIVAETVTSVNQSLLSILTTADDRITIFVATDGRLRLFVVTGTVTQANIIIGTLTAGVEFTIAFSFKTNAVRGSLNGAAAVSDTLATIPAVTTALLGTKEGTTNFLRSGTLALVTQYPVAFSGSELEALSA